MATSRTRLFNVLVAIGGGVLLVFTVRQVGWEPVVRGLASIGWAFGAVVALAMSRVAVRALAWAACANVVQRSTGEAGADGAGTGLSVGRAMSAMLSADALGNLTPLGLLASEPAKILLVRSRMSTVASIASVAIENVFYTVSVLLVILGGTWALLQKASTPPALEVAAEVIVFGIVAAGVLAIVAARTRPAVLSAIAPFLSRVIGRTSAPAETMAAVEAQLYGALQWPVARVARVFAWEASFHALAVAESALVLRLLPGGSHTTLVDAFLMESVGRFVTAVFKFIPFRLGVDEAGSGAVASVLGLNPAVGVTMAMVRRLRILALNGAGLVLFARRR